MDLPSEYVRVREKNERCVHKDCVYCIDGVSALEHNLETGAKKNKDVLLTLALVRRYRNTTVKDIFVAQGISTGSMASENILMQFTN